MSNLFLPNDQKERDLTIQFERDFLFSEFEDVLVYCCGDKIYYTLGFNDEPQVLKERRETIMDICVNDGHFYDVCGNHIYQDLIDGGIKRDEPVYALYSHEGEVYDGGRYNDIWNTLEGNHVMKIESYVHSFAEANMMLFASTGVKLYTVPFGGKAVDYSEKKTWIYDLCSYEDDMFIARGDYDTEMRKDLGGFVVSYDTGETVAARDNSVLRLVSIDGKLYDIDGLGKVHETFSNKFVGEMQSGIKKAISVSKSFLEDLL